MTLAAILSIGSGCDGGIKALGGGYIPQYPEPPELSFTPEEQAVLVAFAADHPDLFKKIQAQSHAWRSIVRQHNKWARDINKKRLDALGYNKEKVEAIYGE